MCLSPGHPGGRGRWLPVSRFIQRPPTRAVALPELAETADARCHHFIVSLFSKTIETAHARGYLSGEHITSVRRRRVPLATEQGGRGPSSGR